MRDNRFKNKHVVVIGSGFGLTGPEDIGRASAAAFAAEGANVAFVQFTKEAADEVASEIQSSGGSALSFTADFRDPHCYGGLAESLEKLWPAVDALVINHFATYTSSFENTTLEQFEETVRVNLTGVFMAVKAFLPLLRRANGASIVNVGSLDGTLGNPNAPSYSASKGGVHVLSHVLAGELAKDNIRVNCIARAASTAMPLTGNVFQSVNSATPMARAGTPEEYAASVLFLASAESSYITGVVLPIDGGRTAVTPGTSPGYTGYIR